MLLPVNMDVAKSTESNDWNVKDYNFKHNVGSTRFFWEIGYKVPGVIKVYT